MRAASPLAHCAAGFGTAAVVHTFDAVVAVGSSIVHSNCRRWRRYSCATAGILPAATTPASAHAAREGRAASVATQAFATLAAAFTLGRPAASAAAIATLAVSSTATSAFASSTASATASRTRK